MNNLQNVEGIIFPNALPGGTRLSESYTLQSHLGHSYQIEADKTSISVNKFAY